MSVGKSLVAARRSQGKSLTEIVAATRIMSRMLDALEHERWDDLPAPVYVKGYIQNYATALGLDPAPFLEEYAADQQGVVPKTRLERTLESIPARPVVPQRRELHAVPRQVWIALAVALVLVGLVVWGITALLTRDDTPPPLAPVTTPTSTIETTEPVPGVTGDEATATPDEDAEALPAEAFTLSVLVADGQASWLRVTVDGLVAYEGTLPGGEPKEWTVTDEAVVRIGKPASVTVMRDDTVVDVPLGQGIAEVRILAGE